MCIITYTQAKVHARRAEREQARLLAAATVTSPSIARSINSGAASVSTPGSLRTGRHAGNTNSNSSSDDQQHVSDASPRLDVSDASPRLDSPASVSKTATSTTATSRLAAQRRYQQRSSTLGTGGSSSEGSPVISQREARARTARHYNALPDGKLFADMRL